MEKYTIDSLNTKLCKELRSICKELDIPYLNKNKAIHDIMYNTQGFIDKHNAICGK